ncbi:hypothetical protein BgAZ_201810 [Babesia gibsoni]|uniref:Uncharacterized protein n=1 Tax=Babesia gibsoni TaxID=33632 RepID=A0AAD8LSS4_BABGI|nr:hypothetical protein BgAZ_201810 [Babesia gibsoni]
MVYKNAGSYGALLLLLMATEISGIRASEQGCQYFKIGSPEYLSVVDALEGIYIADFKFDFNHAVHEYIQKVETCMDSIELFFLVPEWMKPLPDETPIRVAIFINGNKVDNNDGGYTKLTLYCGMTNDLEIDVTLEGEDHEVVNTCYIIHIDVPYKGGINTIEVLEVTKSDGTSVYIKPTLSMAYTTHTALIGTEDNPKFNVYVECKEGLPTIGDVSPGNSATLTVKPKSLRTELLIKCGEIKDDSDEVILRETVYTVMLERSSDKDVPDPRSVISLMDDTKYTSLTKYATGRSEYSPLIVETDPDYVYVMPVKYVVDGNVKEIHSYNEDYVTIKNENLTPVVNTTEDITIYGIKGNQVRKFVLPGLPQCLSGKAYGIVISILIINAYVITLVTTLLPQIIKAYKGILFDRIPVLSEPLMYLVQNICSYGDNSTKKLCQGIVMLPNMGDNGIHVVESLTRFYIQGAVLLVVVTLLAVSKQSSQELSTYESERTHRYIPIQNLINIFAFPWSFLTACSILKPFIGASQPPNIEVYFISAHKVKGSTPMSNLGWSDVMYFYLTIPMAIFGLIALRRLYHNILMMMGTLRNSMNEKELLWVAEQDEDLDHSLNYSYYDEQEPELVDSLIQALYKNNNSGYWSYRRCHVISTQFSNTRKFAILVASIKEVDLRETFRTYEYESQYMFYEDYDELEHSDSSMDQKLPETIRVSQGMDITKPKAVVRLVPRNYAEVKIENASGGGIKRKLHSRLTSGFYLPLQIDYIKRVDPRFWENVVAKVTTKCITYYLTYRTMKLVHSLEDKQDFISLSEDPTFIQATVKQLYVSEWSYM